MIEKFALSFRQQLFHLTLALNRSLVSLFVSSGARLMARAPSPTCAVGHTPTTLLRRTPT